MRAIARVTRSDRKTVSKYVAGAGAIGLEPGAAAPRDEQVAAVLAAVRGSGRPGEILDRLTPHREQIVTWLADGLRLTKIHRRLRDHGVTIPYSSLPRFAQAHLGFGARVRELFGLHGLAAHDNVIFCGPVGVGKSWFAQALGHSACRGGHHVRDIKVAKLLLALHQSRRSIASPTAPIRSSWRARACARRGRPAR